MAGKRKNKQSNRNLVKVAKLGEIGPGQRKVIMVNGSEIMVFNLDGELSAISNVCPHRGYPLTYGPIFDDTIMCPNHGYMFNVKTGHCLTKSSHPIKTYKVIVDGNSIKIEL
jgi:nitrite reductase/ring-hydroxylating ferredoxin subunit